MAWDVVDAACRKIGLQRGGRMRLLFVVPCGESKERRLHFPLWYSQTARCCLLRIGLDHPQVATNSLVLGEVCNGSPIHLSSPLPFNLSTPTFPSRMLSQKNCVARPKIWCGNIQHDSRPSWASRDFHDPNRKTTTPRRHNKTSRIQNLTRSLTFFAAMCVGPIMNGR